MNDTPENRQYVAVKFRIGDTRTYTYSWDGEAFADGDVVRVPDRSGDGWNKVFVVSTTNEKPPYSIKPIIGLHVEEGATPLEAAVSKYAAAEAARCKAAGIFNTADGYSCTTCNRPVADCECLPF